MWYKIIFVLLLLFVVIYAEQIWKLLNVSRAVWSQAKIYQSRLVDDTTEFQQQYDFIIVGGGSAGCIVANRLTENSQHSVLLLEAGGDENYLLTIPAISPVIALTRLNWGHKGVKEKNACQAYEGGRCSYPRGKVLGGSSTVNAVFYTRGNKKDYDRWLEMGNYGWGFGDVLPYFKKFEDVQIPEYVNEFRGTGGPVPINFSPYETQIGSSFFNSLKKYGLNNVNYNGEYQTGFSKVELSTANGSRYSMNRAYLMPIKYRKNLHVSKNSFVTKLIINPITKTTEGVEFIKNNKKYQILAKKEVILSAGAFGTPQILMLSGIGPEDHLNELKIPVIKNLKVGYNLQDHVSFAGLIFIIDKPLSNNFRSIVLNLPTILNNYFIHNTGALATTYLAEGVGFINTALNNDTSYPDIEIVISSSSVTSMPFSHAFVGVRKEIFDYAFRDIQNLNIFTMFLMLLRPESIGRLTLKSNNPYKLPNILVNYFKEERDIDVMIQGIRFAIQLSQSEEFKKLGTRVHEFKLEACNFKFNTDEFWRCALRQLSFVSHHFVGTAKMGPKSDPDAVVDPELRVFGVKGLRVIDASVMPFVPSAHTAAPTMMIAEKGADLIKHSWL